MSKNDESINDDYDESFGWIHELSEDDPYSLLEHPWEDWLERYPEIPIREDRLERFLEIRGQYIDRLDEEGLLINFPEGSPWADYYEQHPNDPIFQTKEIDVLEQYRRWLKACCLRGLEKRK